MTSNKEKASAQNAKAETNLNPGKIVAQLTEAAKAESGAVFEERQAANDLISKAIAAMVLPGWTDEGNGALSFEPRPGERYTLSETGLTYSAGNTSVEVCGYLRVTALICDDKGEDRRREVTFRDLDGGEHACVIPDGLLVKSPAQVVSLLASKGLEIRHRISAQGGSQYIVNYLKDCPCKERRQGTDRFGWFKPGEVFCLPPGKLISFEDDGADCVFTGNPDDAPDYCAKGTLAEWQEAVAKPALYSSRLSFALCLAFAPVLQELAGQESGGFHFYGESSKGKSTCSRVLASVWTQASADKELGTWRATDNGLEAKAAARNNLPMILDEIGQAEPTKLEQIIYMLANETGKARQSRSLTARKSLSWRLMVFSTGEKTIAEYAEDVPRRRTAVKEGVLLRVADVPAVAHAENGVFDRLPLGMDSAEVADALNEAAQSKTYGTAGEAFIRRLLQEIQADGLARFKEKLDGLMTSWLETYCTSKDSQVRRVAKRCALVAAAGEIASRYGVLPWNSGAASDCAAEIFRAWRTGFSTAEERDKERLSSVFDALTAAQANFGLRTPGMEKPCLPERSPLYGYAELLADGRLGLVCVIPKMFREMLFPADSREALRVLGKKGCLIQNNKPKPEYKAKKGQEIIFKWVPLSRAIVILMPGAEKDDRNDRDNPQQ